MVHSDDDIYSECDSEGFVQDMRAFGVGQALPLDADGIEAEAAAYLRAVREEAARIPHVCTGARLHAESEVSTSQAHGATPDELTPSYEWTCTVVDNFVAARAQVQFDIEARTPVEAGEKLPHVGNRAAWLELTHSEHAQPFSSTLARLDNTLASWCLRCLTEETEKGSKLQPQVALWMYGLMVRLEKPVQPSVAAVLRQVSELAVERRCRLPKCDKEMDSAIAAEVAMYDTLRVLAGGFFGQNEHMAPLVHEYLLRTSQISQ